MLCNIGHNGLKFVLTYYAREWVGEFVNSNKKILIWIILSCFFIVFIMSVWIWNQITYSSIDYDGAKFVRTQTLTLAQINQMDFKLMNQTLLGHPLYLPVVKPTHPASSVILTEFLLKEGNNQFVEYIRIGYRYVQ